MTPSFLSFFQKMNYLLLAGVTAFLIVEHAVWASLPCGEIHKDLAVPCRCDVRPTNLLEQGIGVLMDCDRMVFPGELPTLPLRAPIIGFR